MDFDTWEPVYERILADFGFPRAADERARDVLADLVGPFDTDGVDVAGQRVAIAGAAPDLEAATDRATTADVVVAASVAGPRLVDAGVDVDYLVTDLDGRPERAVDLSARGVVVLAHAHGDNIPAIETYVPRLDEGAVLPTTQAAPAGSVRNFGGFTDGDRAAFFADHFGAGELVFPGWELADPTVSDLKARKLRWAERLLYWLERRRGERFDVLEGRRDALTTPVP
ncbi:MAG: 6-hydroxymethylpterin diphosphokinase MptE-like protein [Halorientalis sp.]